MSAPVVDRIREGIEEKRSRLSEWLEAANPEGWAQALGPMAESAVQAHLAQLDLAVERSHSGELGLCEVCHEPVNNELLELDYTASVCLEHLSEAQLRDLERELQLAQGVQRELLPQEVPDVPGLQIAAYSRPAQIVSGDFFDFYRFEDGRTGVVVADVAGHNPPALVGPNSEGLTWLMPTGPALGLTEEAEYTERMVPFGDGDMLTLYTDGIPESFDLKGEQFGQDRLEALLRRAAPAPAPEAVRIVRAALQAFVGEHPPSDDITLIVLRGTAS